MAWPLLAGIFDQEEAALPRISLHIWVRRKPPSQEPMRWDMWGTCPCKTVAMVIRTQEWTSDGGMSETERVIARKQGQGDGHLGSSQIIAIGKTKLPKCPVLCLFLYRKQKVEWGGDDLHFLSFWPCHMACGILIPQPEIKPVPLQWKHRVLTLDCLESPSFLILTMAAGLSPHWTLHVLGSWTKLTMDHF